MDNETTISQLSNLVSKFCEERDWKQFHNTKDLAIGIVTEASELLDIFRFKSDADIREMLQDSMKRDEIGDELADILYFVLRFAQINGYDLSQEFARKLDKNQKKYPVSTSRGSNRKYDDI